MREAGTLEAPGVQAALLQRERLVDESIRQRQKESEASLIKKERDLLLAYEDQLSRARSEMERGYREREEAVRGKVREAEEGSEARRLELEKAAVERRQKLEDDFERRRRESVAALAAEREATIAQLDARVREVEAEKARSGSWLAQKEAKIAGRYQELERQLRQELNLTKIEYASQLDERTRKLAEGAVKIDGEAHKDLSYPLAELPATLTVRLGKKAKRALLT